MENTGTEVKILVVDDSDVILHALKNFFQDYAFEVVTCHDGLEGVQKSIEIKPTLIILDLMMPNLDGVKMLKVIKVMNEIKDIPVIVISGNTNKRNVLAAIEAGAETVLSKPLKKEVLKRSISEILGPDLFKKTKIKTVAENDNDNKALIQELKGFFINSFSNKKDLMLNAIKNKNVLNLRHVFHELKGSGTSIGYPELTKIGHDVEERIDEENIDWEYFEKRCNEVIEIVNKMKNQKSVVD